MHTGTGGDVVTKSYPANDVLTVLTPAPANENAKQVQKEYDGLGRLKSVCVLSNATGKASCGQTTSASGFLTTYSYDAAGRLLQTVENAQVSSPKQPRTYTYDLLGRVLSETNPEWAPGTSTPLTAYYTYDSVSGTNCTSPSPGDMVQKVDPNGNTTCYHYDGLHRNTYITYAGPNSGVSKYFVYDAATVDSTAMSNAEGRLAEAYTCSGSGAPPCTPAITDEGFSYDQRGLMSAYYQKSPNSGGSYYTMTASHWPDRQIEAITGVGLPTITYGATGNPGLDGEGRVTRVTASAGTNPVSAVAYNNGPGSDDSIGSLLTATLGAGDKQQFTYDPNTGRMASYSASVGATPVVISGTLTWNQNGTLFTNNIVDGLPPSVQTPQTQNQTQAQKAQNQTIDPQEKLKAKPVKHPPQGTTEIQWTLSKKSRSGGFIVQEITTTDSSGNQTYHYWEAWPVSRGSKNTTYHDQGYAYDDMFRDPSGTTVHGSARFYEGLQLPGSFVPHGPRTIAGDLPATAINPNLPTNNATAPVDRTWTAP